MIAIVMMIFSLAGAVGVFLVRFVLFGIFVAVDKRKGEDNPMVPEYIYTQLESWSDEIKLNNSVIKEYKESIKLATYNKKRREQLQRKIIQLQKQTASAEKNIRVNCEKYNIDPNDYLPYNWG